MSSENPAKLHITQAHSLPKDVVHFKISGALDNMARRYHFRFSRQGDVYTAKNAIVSGTLTVRDAAVVVDMEFGLAGLMLNIQDVVRAEVACVLRVALT